MENWLAVMCDLISRFCITLYWSICLFLCQHFAVLITKDLYNILKSPIIHPSLFFFVQMSLAIRVFVVPNKY